jgi:NADPH:quinone reductase
LQIGADVDAMDHSRDMSAAGNGIQAAVVRRVGELPVVSRVERPRPHPDRRLIEVAYSTLNPIEIRLAAGQVGGPPDVPYVPGMEGVGRVMDGPQAGSLVRFECPLPGHGRDGALRQVAEAEPESIVVLPDGADPVLAAGVGVIGITAALALDTAEPVAGTTVAVLGASGSVGKQAIQLARLRGAGRIVAAARDGEQLKRARELGADEVVELRPGAGRAEVTNALLDAAQGRLDVVVDPLWGVPGAAAVGALADGGRLVNIGQAAGGDEPPPLAELRNRRAALLGVSSGWTPLDRKREAYGKVLDAALAGRLEVDREVGPLADIAAAWRRQQGSPHVKLVIDVQS